MIRILGASTLLIVILAVAIGCSTHKTNPVSPLDSQSDLFLPLLEPEIGNSNHNLLGTWVLSINPETLEATVEPDRALNSHHNLTQWIPAPLVVINSWDDVEEIIDVDVTLHNPISSLNAFDVRLIIYTDDAHHILVNDDNWTRLWDIPGGQIANPFRTYAKDTARRWFEGESSHTENFQIQCPNSDFNIQFAVDASYPGNCKEPYEINNFEQCFLGVDVGDYADVTVDVHHWLNDVSEVYLICPEITGETEIPFEYVSSNKWHVNLVNNTGASAGWYNAWIYAISPGFDNLEMIDRIKITVSTTGIPQNPVFVGEYRTPLQNCETVSVHNGYLFAFDKYYGLYALDISNPSEPEIISNLPLEFPSVYDETNLDCSGNYALLGSSKGFGTHSIYYSIDISDPFNMEIVGSIDLGYGTFGMSYEGNYAVLGANVEMLVLDMSTPSNPFLTAVLDNESSYPIFVGDYVYTDGRFWSPDIVSVVDMSDPTNPVRVNQYDAMGTKFSATPLALDGNILTVASSTTDLPTSYSYVETLDVSDPLHPVSLDYIQYTSYSHEYIIDTVYSVTALDGNVVFSRGSSNGQSIHLLDISDPGNILEKDMIGGNFDHGAISGHYCYVDDFGLGIIDLTNPGNMTYKNGFYLLIAANFKITNSGLIYVANRSNNSLCVIDAFDPQNPQLLSEYNLGYMGYYEIFDLEIFGDYIFLRLAEDPIFPSGPDRILVLDATDPYSLSEVTFLDVGYRMRDLDSNGEYLYVSSDEGLFIYNVSNPQNFILIGSTSGECKNVIQKGNYAYVVSWGNPGKFMIIDISDPSNPWVAAETDSHYPRDLEIKDNLAFVLEDDHLKIYDISSPADPVEITEFEPLDDANYHLAVSGNYIYLGNKGEIWDVTDLQNPQYLSQMDIPPETAFMVSYDCEIIDNYAYSNCGYFGLRIHKLW